MACFCAHFLTCNQLKVVLHSLNPCRNQKILKNCFIFSFVDGWKEIFDYRPCYEKRMDERMPLSIDNLISLIEKFERNHLQTPPENIAEAVLYR